MAVLADNNTGERFIERSQTDAIPQYATADRFYLNALLSIKDGVVGPLGTQTGTGARFVGICTQEVSTSASGAKELGADVGGATIRRTAVTGAGAATDVTKEVYCATDNIDDFTLTEGTAFPVGRVTRWYSATLCDVQLFTREEALDYELSRLRKQDGITAKTGVSTISLADIKTKLITLVHTVGATVALTLDTGALMDASFAPIGFAYEWTLINLSVSPGTDTGTVTSSAGHTLVGNMVVGSATGGLNSRRFITRKTAAATWITYAS